ncbi:GT2 family glycosyltransferase [Halospina denitrificans]|uniref:GT2 family glycosyltransferase n=1 Tax=Halospina denitrificans TaxID=332522 RepID=A0A4R7JPE0_9GAMM|nr:glycosyltransferase [Halospina denitrificans]TDT39486.1 GT2 family glycosyltransferase [Halospina denitrificans]
MDISILIATASRDSSLEKALEGIAGCRFGGTFEVLVADNAVRSETQQICERFKRRLNVSYVEAPLPGKNHAMNRLLPLARGGLFVFGDDDIIASLDWLQKLYDGAQRHPDVTLFGGRTLPKIGDELSIPDHPMVEKFVNAGNWEKPEGPIENHQVLGTNMMVRREVFDQGLRFNGDVGPKGKDYMMGSETELNQRLFFYGYSAVYLPDAVVWHLVRQEQTEAEWWLKRMQRRGRGSVLLYPVPEIPRFLGAPRFLYKKLLGAWLKMLLYKLKGPWKSYVDYRSDYLFSKGIIQQYRIDFRGERKDP